MIHVRRDTTLSRGAVGLGFMCAIGLLIAPYWVPPSLLRQIIEVICYLVLAQMWNLMAGYGGLVSVGQQAFVGVGGYGLFLFAQKMAINPFLSIFLAGGVAVVIAAITAPMIFRLRAGYFAVGTWVLADALRIGVSNLTALGGGSGMSLTAMAAFPTMQRMVVTYWIGAALIIASSVAVNLLLRSKHGLGLTAVRDSEIAAESQGVNVASLKVQVYLLSAFGTGLVGALYYANVLRIGPDSSFDISWVASAIFIVIVGGIGTLEGPIVGTAIFFLLRWLLSNYGSWYWLAMGGVAILTITFFPRGVWGTFQQRTGIELLPLTRRLAVQRPGNANLP